MAEEGKDCVQTYRKVMEFLQLNKVKGGWQDLIIPSVDLTTKLGEIIYECEKMQSEGKTIRPEDDKILRAFSYAEPYDIKVVIIGTSPAATESIANGLAFSSEQCESSLRPEQAIPKVHQALRIAEKLKDRDYHCSHKKWAKKGVLLLNAALTITAKSKYEKESSEDIKSHCNMWNEFLQELLFEWIIRTPIRHKLFVMRWGYAPRPNMINYAERVWSKVDKHHKLFKDVFERKIHTFPIIHHPTFPFDKDNPSENNFLNDAPGHFKTIIHKHGNIFPLTPVDSVDAITKGTKNLTAS